MKINNLFGIVVKYLGFLKHIPLVAYQFDAMLKLWMLFSNPAVLDWLDDIEAEVLRWPCLTRSLHKYGGLQFNCHGREIGHIHSNGILDMRVSRKIKQHLLAEGRINHHHVFTNSGWISFYVRKPADSVYALQLLRMGYLRIYRAAGALQNPKVADDIIPAQPSEEYSSY